MWKRFFNLKVIIVSFLTFNFVLNSNGQSTILISQGGTVSVNDGDMFYDAGGAAGVDGNTNYTITLVPAVAGASICLDFSMFNTFYSTWDGRGDSVCIFDGSSTSANKMASLMGNYSNEWVTSGTEPIPVGIGQTATTGGIPAVLTPTVFCATNATGSLTISFYGNVYTNKTAPGWVARITTYNSLGTPGCNITLVANPNPVCSGQAVTLNATGDIISAPINNDFNNSSVGTGWQSTASANFGNNFCNNPSLDGSIFLWMANAAGPRTLTTNAMNVVNGGAVSFDYRQASVNTPGGFSPCESPDISSAAGGTPEAVYLQYSINNGTTWTTFKAMYPYHMDNNNWDGYPGCGYEVMKWNKIIVPIPAVAKTANTMFRWHQQLVTNSTTDNWGLDNVVIASPSPTPKTITITDQTNGGTVIGTSSTSTLTNIVNPANTTTYRATITDGSISCYEDVVVTINSSSSPAISYATPFCASETTQQSVTLTGNSGGVYTSSPAGLSLNATTGAITPSSSTPGTYAVTYTTTGACAIGTTNVTINSTSAPVTSFSYNSPVCADGTNPVPTPTGGFTIGGIYSSMAGLSLNSATGEIDLGTSTAGNYNINYAVNASGCATAGNSNASITINPLPTISSTTPGSRCNTGTVVLSASASAGTVNWYTSGTGGVAIATGNSYTTNSISTTTTYYVDATSNGCTTTVRIPVVATINLNPTIDLGNDTAICASTSITINAGNTGSTFAWSTSATTQSISANSAGTYSVTVTTAAGCTAIDNKIITVNPLPVATVSPASTSVCNGNQATLTASGGTSYIWNTIPLQQTTATISVSPATNTTYIVTVTNSCGSDTASANISVNTITPVITPTLSAVCQGQTTILTAVGGQNFIWSTGSITDTIIVSPSANTTYSVTVSSGSCNATQTILINVHNAITATATPATVCVGESTVLTVSGGLTFEWQDSLHNPISGLNSITVTPTDTTSYYAIASDGSCSDTVMVTVIVHSLPVVDLGADIAVCSGTAVIIDALNNGSSYLWNDSTTNQTITVNTSGLFSVTVANSNGCSASDYIQATINPLPTISLTAFAPVCSDASPFTITGGIPAGGSYSGTGVSGSIFNPVTAGTGTHAITYSYTDGNGCTNTPATQNITVNSLPVISFSALNAVCLDAAVITLTEGSPVGGTYSGSGITGNTFNPANAGSGTHTITYSYTDGNGCTNIPATQSILVNSLPTITLAALSPLCVDAAPLSLNGGLPTGGTYSGSGVTGNNFNASVAGVGTHIISYSYTDGNGCTNSPASQNILVNTLPVISLSALTPVCVNATPFTLTGGLPAGGIYSGTGVSGSIFNPLTAGAGTHTITYSFIDGNGCTNTPVSQNITVNAQPIISLGTFSPLCVDAATITLNNGMPADGSYSGSGVNGNTFIAAMAGPGLHSITYSFTDGNGCTNTPASQNILVNALPTITLSAFSPVCLNANAVNLTGGSPLGGLYSGTGVTGNSFNPATAGSGTHAITYSYTDANGCTNTPASQNIIVNALPDITLANFNSVCINASPFPLSGGMPAGGTYSGPGITGTTFNPGTAGTGTHAITYTYTDANGCTNTPAMQNISVNQLPAITLASFNPICFDATPITLTGGLPSGGSYSGSGVTTGVFNPTSAGLGPHLITYSYTDANSCSNSASTSIAVNAVPTIIATAPASRCSNGTVMLGATASAGTVNWYANATGGTVLNSGSNFTTPSVSVTTTYYVEATALGCTTATRIPIVATINPLPTITFPAFANSYCLDFEPFVLNTANPQGGQYSGPGVSGNNFSPLNAGAGTHSITYFYQDNNNCFNTASASITVFPLPNASAGNHDTICSGNNITLQGNGGTSYSWIGPSGFTSNLQNPVVSPMITSVYTVTVTDNNSCSKAAIVSISVVLSPEANAGQNAEICANEFRYFITGASANYPQNITWTRSGNGTFSNSHALNPTYNLGTQDYANGFVYLKISVNSDCGIAKDSLKLIINHLPNIQTNDTVHLIAGGSMSLIATGGISYMWTPQDDYIKNPNTQSPVINPVISTYYVVKGFDAKGCYNFDTVQVIIDADNNIFVPSAFSPWSRTEMNKKLYVFGRGMQHISFMVFDRWGEKVFETNQMETDEHSSGWDGNFKGTPMNPAVFVWKLVVNFYNGERLEKSGNVTLVR